jgi:hypothetical protein
MSIAERMNISEELENLDLFIVNFEEQTFRSNIEKMLDYECWFHKIPSKEYKKVGQVWKALTEYYVEHLYHVIDAYQTQDMEVTRLTSLEKRDVATLCHNIYDHYKKRIHNEIR